MSGHITLASVLPALGSGDEPLWLSNCRQQLLQANEENPNKRVFCPNQNDLDALSRIPSFAFGLNQISFTFTQARVLVGIPLPGGFRRRGRYDGRSRGATLRLKPSIVKMSNTDTLSDTRTVSIQTSCLVASPLGFWFSLSTSLIQIFQANHARTLLQIGDSKRIQHLYILPGPALNLFRAFTWLCSAYPGREQSEMVVQARGAMRQFPLTQTLGIANSFFRHSVFRRTRAIP
jgi:hypothetical protein